jgi:hypothetical protein
LSSARPCGSDHARRLRSMRITKPSGATLWGGVGIAATAIVTGVGIVLPSDRGAANVLIVIGIGLLAGLLLWQVIGMERPPEEDREGSRQSAATYGSSSQATNIARDQINIGVVPPPPASVKIEPPPVREARHAMELAEAELVAFDRTNAGVWFKSKDRRRRQLVEQSGRANLELLRAIHAAEQNAVAASKSPADITREFLTLREKGLILRGRINAVMWEDRQENLGFGQDELDEWLEECRVAVWELRPDAFPAFRVAVTAYITPINWAVHTVETAALDLWPERTQRIDLVVAVLDRLIAAPQPSSAAISSQDPRW